MIFPEFIKDKSVIGVTAPSDGNRKEIDFARCRLAVENMERAGFQVKTTPNVYTSSIGRSSGKEERVLQLMRLIEDDKVKWIVMAKGGDFLLEILPLLDFDRIGQFPKWMQGFSDNTGLLFAVTTICDIATVYGNHFNDFAITPVHLSQQYNLECLSGNQVQQKSFPFYEEQFTEKENAGEGYREDKKVLWRAFRGRTEIAETTEVSGRLLGGCLDVLLSFMGTKYDRTAQFCRKYKDDGILWYLESFALDSESVFRGLWQMREAGWFENASGFVFGRPCFFESAYGITYENAVISILGDMNKPILFGADIGHRQPSFTVINGAVGTFVYHGGKGVFEQQLGL